MCLQAFPKLTNPRHLAIGSNPLQVSDFGISAFMDNTIAQVPSRRAGAVCGWASGCSPAVPHCQGAVGAPLPGPPAPSSSAPCPLLAPPQCNTFLGTVTYMSPERINGQPYSFPADIWALGLTLLECATGRYPYDASGGTIQLMIQVCTLAARLGWAVCGVGWGMCWW